VSSLQRKNSRGWVWLPWTLLILCGILVCIGIYGSIAISSAPIAIGLAPYYSQKDAIETYGWAVTYLDSYFLMFVVSAIWIQVCSTAADTEEHIASIEKKLDRLLEEKSEQKTSSDSTTIKDIESQFESLYTDDK